MNIEKLHAKYGEEKVLCIPNLYEEGYCYFDLMHDITRFGEFKLRYKVEQDENWLQVIPYVVVKNSGKYFVTRRLAGDERLKGMVAFLGGHVNPIDRSANWLVEELISADATMHNCVLRELREETTISDWMIGECKCIKVFVDTRAPVSRVHICALVITELPDEFVKYLKIRETEKLEGDWVTLEELKEAMDNGKMEGWAEIATKELLKGKGE